jgi:hypothetical protein
MDLRVCPSLQEPIGDDDNDNEVHSEFYGYGSDDEESQESEMDDNRSGCFGRDYPDSFPSYFDRCSTCDDDEKQEGKDYGDEVESTSDDDYGETSYSCDDSSEENDNGEEGSCSDDAMSWCGE